MYAALQHPGCHCLEPQGAFDCFPTSKGCSAAKSGGRTPDDTAELCEVLLDEAQVAIVPGRHSARRIATHLFALGDDDLGEGVRRIADFLS